MTIRHQAFLRNALFRVLLGVCAIAGGCVAERSVDPKPVNYVMYLSAEANGNIYAVELDSLRIVDSIVGIGTARFMAVSPDGSTLYTSGDHPQLGRSLLKISTSTGAILGNLPSPAIAPVILFGDGRYIAGYADKRLVIDVSTFQQITDIPDSLVPLPTTAASDEILVRVGGRESLLLYSPLTGTTRGGYHPHLMDGTAVPVSTYARRLHAPTSRIAMITETASGLTYFVLGDMLTGNTLLEYKLMYPFGDVAFNNDGSLVAVSDPSNPGWWETPISIDVFDLKTLSHLRRLSPSQTLSLQTCDRLWFVLGSNSLLAGPRFGPFGGGPFQLLDIVSGKVSQTTYLPFMGTSVGGVELGRLPR